MQTNGRYERPQERVGAGVTDHYSSLQIAARNHLASCSALAILSGARAGVPSPYDEAVWQDLRADAGIIEQGYLRKAGCSAGARRPDRPYRAHLPDYRDHLPTPTTGGLVSEMRRSRTRRRSGTCCPCPRGGVWTRRLGAVEFRLEVRRSICRNRVNSDRDLALSIELCSKFLNELAPPVNIAYQ
jgi:hypothetical protein